MKLLNSTQADKNCASASVTFLESGHSPYLCSVNPNNKKRYEDMRTWCAQRQHFLCYLQWESISQPKKTAQLHVATQIKSGLKTTPARRLINGYCRRCVKLPWRCALSHLSFGNLWLISRRKVGRSDIYIQRRMIPKILVHRKISICKFIIIVDYSVAVYIG